MGRKRKRRQRYDETTVSVRGGQRCVAPYAFEFRTFCKGRWVGRALLEVFATEFGANTPARRRARAIFAKRERRLLSIGRRLHRTRAACMAQRIRPIPNTQ